ncbi:MAG: hypothetical protein HDR11_08990 [Lachnospiraceae bacterium]|nr:hypothetical protein [Lachnospiraceae bacterium]
MEKIAKDKLKYGKNICLSAAVMFSATVLSVCVFSYLKGLDGADVIRNTVMSGIGVFTVLLFMAQAKAGSLFEYDNGEHMLRFMAVYLICLAFAFAIAYLPAAGWPYLAAFVFLTLFSNLQIGICAGTILLAVSILLSGNGAEIFILYFVCGFAGASLFKGLNEAYKIGIPVAVSLMFLLTGETACVVLYANETLKPELFLIPLINVIACLVLLLIILRVFSALVIYKHRNKYMEINDQEYTLLVELKEKSKKEYYQAVHTAHFCERISQTLSLDVNASKTGGYYRRIGILRGENTWEVVSEIAAEHAFPPEAVRILREFLDKTVPIRQKETVVLLMSDAVINSILQVKKNEKPDYDKIIETIFKRKMESGVLKDCIVTMEELNRMKTIFKEGKLYYDFLH